MEHCIQGNKLFVRGKYSEARRAYKEALEHDPNHVTFQLNYARTQFKLGFKRNSLQDVNHVLQNINNTSVSQHEKIIALALKYEILKSLNKEDEALQVRQQLLEEEIIDLLDYNHVIQVLQSGGPDNFFDKASDMYSPSNKQATTSPGMSSLCPPSSEVSKEAKLKIGSNKNLINVASPSSSDRDQDTSDLLNSISEEEARLIATKTKIQGGVGDPNVDGMIIYGYLQVNNGRYSEAIIHFTSMMEKYPNLTISYVARGTAYALMGELKKAIDDFSAAIGMDSKNADAWRRRGQSRAACGIANEAISDLTESIKLAPEDPESYHQRGSIFHSLKNYRRAVGDFQKSLTYNKNQKASWNQLGLCLNQLGSCLEAIAAYEKAVQLDPMFKEAWLNMAQSFKDWGMYDRAESTFSKVIEIDPNYCQVYYMRGMARYSAGEINLAIEDATTGKKLNPKNLDITHLKAISFHNLGRFREAVKEYDDTMLIDPTFFGYYQREIAIKVHHLLDLPIDKFNLDSEFDPYFKEGWSKRANPALLTNYVPQLIIKCNHEDVSQNPVLTDKEKLLLKLSEPFGKRIQLKTPGFLANKRQHRMCGLSVLEMAQTVAKVWSKPKGSFILSGEGSSKYKSPHPFGWRDFFDIAVRWRQISEPNDPVFWIDLLAPEAYEEGFGLQTPMFSGQMKVPRYYPYYEKGLKVVKELVMEQWALTDDMRDAILQAETCEEIHKVMGRDFWVVTNVASTSKQKEVLEGTRLTILKRGNEGYEFSIRTPAKPNRWEEFDQELTYLWNEIETEARKDKRDTECLSDLIMRLYFYWVNFGPLTRGTAALGLIAMMALFLAIDIEIESVCQTGKQLDFESIMGGDPNAFIKEHSVWLYPLRKSSSLLQQLPPMSDIICSPRKMIEMLNAKVVE